MMAKPRRDPALQGLTGREARVLRAIIDAGEPVAMRRIIAMTDIAQTNLSQVITCLVQKGLAERRHGIADDQRFVLVEATQAGLALTVSLHRHGRPLLQSTAA